MSNATVVVFTAPYGNGLSKRLEKGKTYYVQITRYFEPYMEDSEDYEEPFCGWHCKRKIKIKNEQKESIFLQKGYSLVEIITFLVCPSWTLSNRYSL